MSKTLSNNKQKYIYVKFEESDMEYIYQTDLNCKIGNIVEAPTLNYVIMKKAIVTKIKHLSDNELPIDKSRILRISKIFSKKDEEGVFDNISYIKKYIEAKYSKIWHHDSENDWVKCWKSNFGGHISYEYDGIFEVCFGELYDDNFFISYTITDKENFNIKLKFAETILSKLYYKIITKEEFSELFSKI